jgi:hypothetical protein
MPISATGDPISSETKAANFQGNHPMPGERAEDDCKI